jgi:hypothetical protein
MWPVHEEHRLIFSALSERTRTRLNSEQWIGRDDPVSWFARSLELNSLDFWLWGYLNTLVCSAPINGLEVLEQRVENAC